MRLISFLLIAFLSTATLADGHHHGHGGYYGGYGYNYGYNSNNLGAFLGGAVAGAIIGGLANPYRYAPPQTYYPPPPPPPAFRPMWDPYCGCYINVPVYP